MLLFIRWLQRTRSDLGWQASKTMITRFGDIFQSTSTCHSLIKNVLQTDHRQGGGGWHRSTGRVTYLQKFGKRLPQTWDGEGELWRRFLDDSSPPPKKERHTLKLIPSFFVCLEDGRVWFLSLLWTWAAGFTLQCRKADSSPGVYKLTHHFTLFNE